MKMQVDVKINYIVFAAITLVVAFFGKFFSSYGMQWYYTLKLPSYTPAGWFISLVWLLIYVLTTVAVVMVWNRFARDKQWYAIMALFALTAILNVVWSYLFFYKHNICLAFADALVLCAALCALTVLISQKSWLVAGLLAPYCIWIMFATWINAMIMFMN